MRDDKRASIILRKCLGRFAHRAMGRAAATWWGDVAVKKTREDLLARAHGTIVARVGDKCHLEVEVHGADHGKIERGPPTVTKAAGVALRLLKRGSPDVTTRDAGNKLRRAWFRWRGRTRLLNALARRLARLATAEARYRLRQAVRDWDRYAQAKILIELDDHGLNAVRFEEARRMRCA